MSFTNDITYCLGSDHNFSDICDYMCIDDTEGRLVILGGVSECKKKSWNTKLTFVTESLLQGYKGVCYSNNYLQRHCCNCCHNFLLFGNYKSFQSVQAKLFRPSFEVWSPLCTGHRRTLQIVNISMRTPWCTKFSITLITTSVSSQYLYFFSSCMIANFNHCISFNPTTLRLFCVQVFMNLPAQASSVVVAMGPTMVVHYGYAQQK